MNVNLNSSDVSTGSGALKGSNSCFSGRRFDVDSLLEEPAKGIRDWRRGKREERRDGERNKQFEDCGILVEDRIMKRCVPCFVACNERMLGLNEHFNALHKSCFHSGVKRRRFVFAVDC